MKPQGAATTPTGGGCIKCLKLESAEWLSGVTAFGSSDTLLFCCEFGIFFYSVSCEYFPANCKE